MKKIIISIINISIIILCLIIIVSTISTKDYKNDLEHIKTVFTINYNPSKINDITIYNGNDTYYIVDYEKNDIAYIAVLNNEEKIEYEHEKSKLKKIKELAKNKYVIGYKYDKLVYEIIENNKNGYIYSYYDALTGEFIKNIKINK